MLNQDKKASEFLEKIKKWSDEKDAKEPPIPPIRFLAAQGGGAKGYAYMGILDGMEETHSLNNLEAVAGASAGSITMFMLGIGLVGEELRLLSDNLSFQDLSDLNPSIFGLKGGGTQAGQIAGYLGGTLASLMGTKDTAYLFSGNNFYDWSAALMMHAVDDPFITFSEFREKCKHNPALKELTFKAYAYEQNEGKLTREVTFSADTTPDIVVIDALRASMAFPVMAYPPCRVHKKVTDSNGDVSFEYYGLFADGGITNNYPIDYFAHANLTGPYRLETKKVPGSDQSFDFNPCSLGLSLTELGDMNPEITPVPDALKQLGADRSYIDGINEHDEQERKKAIGKDFSSYHLFPMILDSVVGRRKIEDYLHKQKVHPTVQVCRVDIGVLEFDLSDERKSNVDRLSKATWEGYYRKNLAPNLHGNQKPNHGFDDTTSLSEKLETYFSIIIQETFACEKRKVDCASNQRIKYYAWLSQAAIKKATPEETLKIRDITHNAYVKCLAEFEERQKKITEHKSHMKNYIVTYEVTHVIKDLLKGNEEDQKKALIYIQGQLSLILECMIRSDSEILCNAAGSGNVEVLEQLLQSLDQNLRLFYQQGRKLSVPPEVMYSNAIKNGLFEKAVTFKNAEQILNVLLKASYFSSPVFDPLLKDKTGKNAFQHAIDKGNMKVLQVLVDYCADARIDLKNIQVGLNGSSLGHTIIEHGPQDLLEQISANPSLLRKLIVPEAKDTRDITVIQLAAHLLTKEDARNSAIKQCLGSVNESILRSELGKYQEQLSLFEERQQSVLDVQKALTFAKNSETIKSLIDQLTPEMCYYVLRGTNNHIMLSSSQEAMNISMFQDGAPFIHQCAMNDRKPLLSEAAFLLYKKIETENKQAALELAHYKVNGCSSLYIAAAHNNTEFLRFFLADKRTRDTLNVGPHHCPSALLAAAKNGANEALTILIDQDSENYWKELWKSYKDPTVEGKEKTLFHYLAFNETDGKAMCKVLKNSRNNESKFFKPITSRTDGSGKTPFRYLMENPNCATILNNLCSEIKSWGVFLGQAKWQLQDVFDFESRREDGLTDLEYAFATQQEDVVDILRAHTLKGLVTCADFKRKQIIKNQPSNEDSEVKQLIHSIMNLWSLPKDRNTTSELTKLIQDLTPEQCLAILSEPMDTPFGTLNFLWLCATQMTNDSAFVAYKLYENIDKSKKPSVTTDAFSLLTAKIQDKTPIYAAAELSNYHFIRFFFDKYGAQLKINESGPEACRSALTVAAKEQAFEALFELCNRAKDKAVKVALQEVLWSSDTRPRKTLMHYLTQHDPNGAGLFVVMKQSTLNLQSEWHALSNQLDENGDSSFRLLLQNPHLNTALKNLFEGVEADSNDVNISDSLKQCKGLSKIGISTWKLDHYFDFTKPRKDKLNDLEYAIQWALENKNTEFLVLLEKHTNTQVFDLAYNTMYENNQQKAKVIRPISKNFKGLELHRSRSRERLTGSENVVRPENEINDQTKGTLTSKKRKPKKDP